MPAVETVRGSIDTADLGTTLMHEHVFVRSIEIAGNYPDSDSGWDEEIRVADAVNKLRDLAERGVTTIVDPTVINLGRHIPTVQRVNEQVDINIIAATGLYTYNDVPIYFLTRPVESPSALDPMARMFIGDIEDGIAGTGVRAAFLKCAIGRSGMTAGVERVMRAVGQAHLRTGAPITVHTDAPSRSGLLVQELFKSVGVDLSMVVIAHCDDSDDLDYLRQLADAGSFLGMDRFGMDMIRPSVERANSVVRLCEQGYTDRVVLSHDAACFDDLISPERLAAMPNWHFTYLLDDIIPTMRALGVTEHQVTTMLVDNPRRYFESRG